ncbi:BQ2448_1992 [Microbotryum intermedium]|uniref:BQ2448_1992 protein n=1 Tax=Microbotryum intermedium TaxID=269621 RepID=A0A238F4U2_9BASI|nr:BQ2448_1992 [Microbotryum intermedium]
MKRRRSVSPSSSQSRRTRRPASSFLGTASVTGALLGRLAPTLSRPASFSTTGANTSANTSISTSTGTSSSNLAPPPPSSSTAASGLRRPRPQEERQYSKKTLKLVEQRKEQVDSQKKNKMASTSSNRARGSGKTAATSATGAHASALAKPRGGAPNPARGNGNPKVSSSNTTPKLKADTAPGPIHDRTYIVSLWPRLGGKGQINDKYLSNPKSIVSNYISSLGAPPKYTTKKVVIEGKSLVRATLIADADPLPPPPVYGAPSLPQSVEPLVGTGDATTSKEAEKLAALHACVQLSARGLFTSSNQPLPDRLAYSTSYGGTNMNGGNAVSGSSTGGATTPAATAAQDLVALRDGNAVELTGGQIVNLEQARGFMDFYCQKFGFDKPDLQITRVAAKGGNNKRSKLVAQDGWQATLLVQGSKIGVAEARNKKQASNRAYLDFARHLDASDPTLWPLWQEKKRANIVAKGHVMAQVVFEADPDAAEDLEEVVYGARESGLYKRARAMIEHQQAKRAEWMRQRRRNVERTGGEQTKTLEAADGSAEQDAQRTQLREARLKEKSDDLKARLRNYQTDQRVEKMREQRASLPVSSHASSVLAKIATSSVTVVLAATGSGKTTQIPQLILDDWILRGDGAKCNVVCTQPRRIAAISVAERVAKERGEAIGDSVGYQVRFESKPPKPDGSILFCTTGLFLRRMQADLHNTSGQGFLDGVTHVCVDEVHERDVDTDLLLFVLRMLLHQRRQAGKDEIRVVLMSATIDPKLFTSYFADERTGRLAPIVEVPGRSFPVEEHRLDDVMDELRSLRLSPQEGGWVLSEKSVVQYLARDLVPRIATNPHTGRPVGEIDDLDMPFPLIALMIANVLAKSEEGHVLVFLPGWDEIKNVQTILSDTGRHPLLGINFNNPNRYEVHVLHSSVPIADQQRVFEPAPKGVRRVVISTNIAETSVTIPDVVYVIDSAKCKEKRYDPERRMSQLVSAWTGTSNLRQRAGRAGRHRPGEYYSIVSDARHAVLDIHQTVEMLRTDLADTCMHITGLQLPDLSVEQVLSQTIQPPEQARIHAAMDSLHMVGAIDRDEKLTSLGRVLLHIPVEVAIGKMCILGSFFRCLEPVLTLAAILTNRDPFMSPIAVKDQADLRKNTFTPKDFRSDPMTILAAYNEWEHILSRQGLNRAYDFTRENFLSFPTLLLIQKIKQHLLQALDKAGVLELGTAGQGGAMNHRFRRRGRNVTLPPSLNVNADSMPLLSSLIAAAAAPNFAIRTSEKTFRTSQDKLTHGFLFKKVCAIHPSSVNSRKNEKVAAQELDVAINEIVSSDQLYAFGEKSKTGSLANPSGGGQVFLRQTTMLDPLGYMLFGAHKLAVTDRGLECDDWLPIVGNVAVLDDVERLKDVLDLSLLRVFEGLGVQISGSGRRGPAAQAVPGAGARDDDRDDDDDSEGEPEQGPYESQNQELSVAEVADLDKLTRHVVKILNRFAEARLERTAATARSRPDSPMHTRPPSGLGQNNKGRHISGGSGGGDSRYSTPRDSPYVTPGHSRPPSSHGFHSSIINERGYAAKKSLHDQEQGHGGWGKSMGGSGRMSGGNGGMGGSGVGPAPRSDNDWRRR